VQELCCPTWSDVALSECKDLLTIRHRKRAGHLQVLLNDDAQASLATLGYWQHADQAVSILLQRFTHELHTDQRVGTSRGCLQESRSASPRPSPRTAGPCPVPWSDAGPASPSRTSPRSGYTPGCTAARATAAPRPAPPPRPPRRPDAA